MVKLILMRTCSRLGVSLVAASVAVACGRNPVSPGDASTSAASGSALAVPTGAQLAASQEKLGICHRTGHGAFHLITIAAAAIDAHLNHGDGLVGSAVPDLPGWTFTSTCEMAAARTTLSFVGLSGTGTPFSTYSESGFRIAPLTPIWTVSTTYGNPAPFILFRRSTDAAVSASIEVTATGDSLFTFESVDVYSSVTPIPYVLTGYRNGVPVFSLVGTQPNTFGNFATVTNPDAVLPIDRLVITLTNPTTPLCPTCANNPVGLDNIVVTRAAS